MKHLSRLILAWAFILSSRWVEILQMAGEKASMIQSEDVSRENFWNVVIRRQWQATMTRDGRNFYAPWCTERYVAGPSVNEAEALPDALKAFQFLESFCLSEGVTKECAAMALAVVLMFPEYKDGPIKLPPLAVPEGVYTSAVDDIEFYQSLSKCLSRCITLSCCDEGIASLLCGGLFEPRVPCNLIGAHLLGVRKAIEPLKNDPKTFARLIVRQNPRLSALWLAAIWTGHASKLVDSALGGMPPISLPAASWTGALQSFIQAGYHSISRRDGFISRAQEFSTIYFVHSDATVPFTPSPPFGEIAAKDTSLDVQKHLLHDHKLMESTTYWILETESQPTQEKPEIQERPMLCLPMIDRGLSDGSFKGR
ncbi:MAG: hypothetical protein Q9217_002668 [Psora testacea]